MGWETRTDVWRCEVAGGGEAACGVGGFVGCGREWLPCVAQGGWRAVGGGPPLARHVHHVGMVDGPEAGHFTKRSHWHALSPQCRGGVRGGGEEMGSGHGKGRGEGAWGGGPHRDCPVPPSTLTKPRAGDGPPHCPSSSSGQQSAGRVGLVWVGLGAATGPEGGGRVEGGGDNEARGGCSNDGVEAGAALTPWHRGGGGGVGGLDRTQAQA